MELDRWRGFLANREGGKNKKVHQRNGFLSKDIKKKIINGMELV